MYETLDVSTESAVATIWLNRPEVHNAFNALLISELTSACRTLGEDEKVRIVILAGRGRSFSAGGDLNWMREAGRSSPESNLQDAQQLATMLRTLAQIPKPTIAKVHGAAMGGGLGLAAACDICVASSSASFATSEVRLGLIPAAISPYVIRAIGPRQAYRYFQTAERISAERALQLGLAHEIAQPQELDAAVAQMVDALLMGGPYAQREAKALIKAVAETALTDALVQDTAQRIAGLRRTPEAQEGLSAFLEKRKPGWVAQTAARAKDQVSGEGA